MSRTLNRKWNAGWLEWGYQLHFITKEAEEELNQLKVDHPDWDFEQLAIDLRSGLIKAWNND